MKGMEKPVLSEREEYIARMIVDSAYHVHKTLGPGLLERVYEVCLCHELQKRGMSSQRQVAVPVVYDSITFEEGFRIDVLVEELAIVEIKAVTMLSPIFEAQLLSYMKLTNKRLGFLTNFHVTLIKRGINRFVL